jgi:hypothetical protein
VAHPVVADMHRRLVINCQSQPFLYIRWFNATCVGVKTPKKTENVLLRNLLNTISHHPYICLGSPLRKNIIKLYDKMEVVTPNISMNDVK